MKKHPIKISSENFSEEKGNASDKVAAAVGISRPTLRPPGSVIFTKEQFDQLHDFWWAFGGVMALLRDVEDAEAAYQALRPIEKNLNDLFNNLRY